ncbi:MAG TPA: bifunctional phosphoribosylaminoimidazolecarboxamide formyltransferase/IMP cyclohydrolase [Bacteriovoracaceae bacterium]|nr:bifunctional phosphoribosylaminoimidazolecarboxamide formyltransferase/IMP cyclohydrolase [Bacteriovoracaceae bacterium]
MIVNPRYALLSVTDKSELIPLAQTLVTAGIKIISTGGTAKALTAAGLPVINIEQITGNPEAFGGRMKSISFQVASGLLYRRGHAQDETEASQLQIPGIDLVVCNLYNFEDHVGKNSAEDELVEEIDIGGPLMIRAAAKNYASVTVLTDPAQYETFTQHLRTNKGTTLEFRRQLACEAFDRIARYDIAIAEELGSRFSTGRDDKFLALKKKQELRYGENPHQKATWYGWKNADTKGLGDCKILQGKELSYNNLLDADAAWKVTSDVQGVFNAGYTAAVIKHGNPCGLAHGSGQLKTLSEAWKGDEVSAFGGIVAMGFEVTTDIATFFQDRFVEIIMAPEFSEEAKSILSKKKNLRLLELPLRTLKSNEKTMRSFHGGVLYQDEDEGLTDISHCQTKTKKKFEESQQKLINFGVMACKHLKSNGIALVGEYNGVSALLGAGMGQPNRLDSLHLLAGHRASQKEMDFKNMILVSDAFFPFADSIEAADKYGIKFVVQPGGSIRDEEVIQKADELGMAMLFTGERHFRH